MSNIPKARKVIEEVIADLDREGHRTEGNRLHYALSLMERRTSTHRGTSKRTRGPITEQQKLDIRQLAHNGLTNADIAVRVLGRASDGGRVSEVLQGLR